MLLMCSRVSAALGSHALAWASVRECHPSLCENLCGMNDSLARPLSVTSAALLALFDLVALLPGNPVVTSALGFAVVVTVQALIVWRLLHRSGIAWFFWVLLSGGYAVGSILFGGPYETTLVVTSLLALMQVGLLSTPPVLVYALGRDKPVAAH
jgi:hypothetical protein